MSKKIKPRKETFEFWKKEYINSILCDYSDERLSNMDDTEYTKVEHEVFKLCENDMELYRDIDFHIIKNIKKALSKGEIK